MDPNANIAELRTLAADILNGRSTDIEADADRMAELFDALDTWIRNGGFLPTSWEEVSV